jgi:hypothetical protein
MVFEFLRCLLMVAAGLRPSAAARHAGGAAGTVRYIANSEYWPVVLVMSLVLIVIAALPGVLASSRINGLSG